MEVNIQEEESAISGEQVRDLLILAERTSGELTDDSIFAVAEATGVPADYVRMVAQAIPSKKTSAKEKFHKAFLQIEPRLRRYISGAALGAVSSLMYSLSRVLYKTPAEQLFLTLMLIGFGAIAWNSAVSRDSKTASLSGIAALATFFISHLIFGVLMNMPVMHAVLFPIIVMAGGLGGFASFMLAKKYGKQFGLTSPVEERQHLLKQLVELQNKLRTGEQSLTFVSVDVAGSTKMKVDADPLAVEFTFNEYHQYVERVCSKYSGRVHSTAGDGVVLAFESPINAFHASRNLQLGLPELNRHIKQAGLPLSLRVGVHTGTVVAPEAGDIRSVNFAHVIDMASHIQKCAPIGGVAVSELTASYLPGGAPSVSQEVDEVMDQKVRVWKPRTLSSAAILDSELPPNPFQ